MSPDEYSAGVVVLLFAFHQPPFKEAGDLLVRFFGGRVSVAVGHGDAAIVAEDFVEGDGVVECGPAFGEVGGSAGDEEGAWGHEGVEFDEVVVVFDKFFVGAGAGFAFCGEFAEAGVGVGVGGHAGGGAEVPEVPVVDGAAGVLFAAVAFVEDDAGIRPDGAGEFVVEGGGEDGPLAAEGVADDANAVGENFGACGEEVVRVGGGVGERGERLDGDGAVFGAVVSGASVGDVVGVVEIDAGVGLADGECDETALGKLVSEVAVFFAESCAGLGIVVDGEDSGEGAVAVGDEHEGVGHFAAESEFKFKLALGDVTAACDGAAFEGGVFDEVGPGAHGVLPVVDDFGAAAFPVVGCFDGGAVGEGERRSVGAEVVLVLGGGSEEGGDFFGWFAVGGDPFGAAWQVLLDAHFSCRDAAEGVGPGCVGGE